VKPGPRAVSSDRAGRPFIAVNCRTIPEHLVETVLFGSFASDSQGQTGKFFEADQGTLFLDEIGELPHEAQIKLLRALQERTMERVGDSRSVTFDIRVIAASNVDLKALVKDGNCAQCHGEGLKGKGEVPRLAGLQPLTIARQLYLIKHGSSNGAGVAPMKPIVAKMNDDAIISISSYLGSLPPA